jgi:hypothetical protein
MGINASVDPEILVLMWICECQNYAEISKPEFKKGLNKLKVLSDQAFVSK